MADDPDSVPVGEGRAPRIPKVARVKNKAPAPHQITAEQLLREAKERQLEIVPPPPRQKIQDADELAEYQVKTELVKKNLIWLRRLVSGFRVDGRPFRQTRPHVKRSNLHVPTIRLFLLCPIKLVYLVPLTTYAFLWVNGMAS